MTHQKPIVLKAVQDGVEIAVWKQFVIALARPTSSGFDLETVPLGVEGNDWMIRVMDFSRPAQSTIRILRRVVRYDAIWLSGRSSLITVPRLSHVQSLLSKALLSTFSRVSRFPVARRHLRTESVPACTFSKRSLLDTQVREHLNLKAVRTRKSWVQTRLRTAERSLFQLYGSFSLEHVCSYASQRNLRKGMEHKSWNTPSAHPRGFP